VPSLFRQQSGEARLRLRGVALAPAAAERLPAGRRAPRTGAARPDRRRNRLTPSPIDVGSRSTGGKEITHVDDPVLRHLVPGMRAPVRSLPGCRCLEWTMRCSLSGARFGTGRSEGHRNRVGSDDPDTPLVEKLLELLDQHHWHSCRQLAPAAFEWIETCTTSPAVTATSRCSAHPQREPEGQRSDG
jgi:hypothetical protein